VASIPKILSALACGGLLSVGFPAHEARAADGMKVDQSHEGLDRQPGLETETGQLKGAIVEGGGIVQDESLFIEGTKYGVKGQEEVGQTEGTTQQRENILQSAPRSDGDRVDPLKSK